jgi:hypothetical protein
MASREHLPELGAEIYEIEGRTAQRQSSLVGALQTLGQIRGCDGHPPSIRCGRDARAGAHTPAANVPPGPLRV